MSDTKLKCGNCSFENEPERVYCHNCGQKLDRSVLPKPDADKKAETPERARKRITKMTNPGAGGLMREIKALFKTLIWAAIVAGLVLFLLKPDDVPEVKRDIPRMVSNEIMEAIESPRPAAVMFTEDEVNTYLVKSVKAKEGLIPGVEFKRMYVNFLGGNVLRIGTEQSIWGLSIYSGMQYNLKIVDGKLVPTCVGGNFGRLGVHPQIMQYADFAFQKLWVALKRDKDQIEKMQNIIIEKGKITLVTRGAVAR